MASHFVNDRDETPQSVADRVVHIVDADVVVLQRSAAFLTSAGYQVQTHASGGGFLRLQPDLRPGCLLLDIHMPEPDGLNIQRQLIEAGVAMPVIVFTGAGEVEMAVRAMRAGALHYLEKPYSDADLLIMVEEAFDRLVAIEAGADRKALAAARLATLSARETQVVQGMMGGLPNKLIAHSLGLSIRTVEAYRINLMDKLKVRTLSAVFRLWFDAGADTPEPVRPVELRYPEAPPERI